MTRDSAPDQRDDGEPTPAEIDAFMEAITYRIREGSMGERRHTPVSARRGSDAPADPDQRDRFSGQLRRYRVGAYVEFDVWAVDPGNRQSRDPDRARLAAATAHGGPPRPRAWAPRGRRRRPAPLPVGPREPRRRRGGAVLMVDLPDSYTRLSWGERGRICELLTQQVHPRRSDTALAERLVEEIRGMASGGKPRWLAAPEHRAALVAWLIEAGVLEQADVWERPDVDLDALEKAKTRYYEGNDERLAAEAAGTPWSTEQVATWDAETRPFFDGRRVQYGPRFYTKDQEPPEGAVLSTGSPTPGRWTVADDDLDLTPEEMTRSWRQSCMEYELAWLGRTGGCPSTRTEANNE